MIFNTSENKKFGYVNLNLEAQKWIAGKKFAGAKNPLNDPVVCQEMVNDVNKKYSLDFSYGGWMEDRSFLWLGSYLDKKKIYTHLGIDVSAPAGTEIMAIFDAKVIKVDDDYPEEGGWGTRVILKHQLEPLYLIYAHMDRNVLCKTGDFLRKGKILLRLANRHITGIGFITRIYRLLRKNIIKK